MIPFAPKSQLVRRRLLREVDGDGVLLEPIEEGTIVDVRVCVHGRYLASVRVLRALGFEQQHQHARPQLLVGRVRYDLAVALQHQPQLGTCGAQEE